MISSSRSDLLKGYVIGVVLALLLTTFASFSRIGRDALSTLTAMLNPLPADRRQVAAPHL
jgi:NitT/TauT family transport system permease protein